MRDFVPNQGLKSADILCVFQGFQTAELVQKSHQLPQVILLLVASNNGGGHKPLNSAAAKVLRVSYDPLGERARICNVDFATLICHSEPVLTLAWESQSTVLNVEIATTSLRTGFAMTTNWGTLHMWGLLAAEPAFAFAGTRSRSVTVRSGEYEPPFCQYGGWTVAAVR